MIRQRKSEGIAPASSSYNESFLRWHFPPLGFVSVIALAVSFLLATPAVTLKTVSYASSDSIQVSVTARVLPYLKVNIIKQPAALFVTESDIKQGFVDVTDGTVFFIMTNTAEGFNLQIETFGGLLEKIVVTERTRGKEMSGAGGIYRMEYSGGRIGENRKISYRLYLSDNAQPGNYSWPLLTKMFIE